MVINEIAPTVVQQATKPEAKNLGSAQQEQDIIEQFVAPRSHSIPAQPDSSLQRKSIFTDQNGVLIAQIKDHTGEIVASYPSNEILRRYHTTIEKIG